MCYDRVPSNILPQCIKIKLFSMFRFFWHCARNSSNYEDTLMYKDGIYSNVLRYAFYVPINVLFERRSPLVISKHK